MNITKTRFFVSMLITLNCTFIFVVAGGELDPGNSALNSSVIWKTINCQNIIHFVNDVTTVLNMENNLAKGMGNSTVANCSIFFKDLTCSLLSFVDSMLNKHMKLNYVMSLSSEICAGLNYRRQNHEHNQYGHVVQFVLDVVTLRHWVSMVIFADEEEDFPSASFLQILAARNIQALILKMNPTRLRDPETIVPSIVSQYYRLVVVSKRYGVILEAAQKKNLFVHPYKWIILADSSKKVIKTLNRISIQFANDLTIVSPIADEENQSAIVPWNNVNRTLVFVCNGNNYTNQKINKNHLVGLSAKEYHIDFFAVLCRERGLDLISSGSWKRDMPSVHQRMIMSWPPHRDIISNNFKGCLFRVAVAHNPPYTILNMKEDGNFTISGYDFDVFMELASVMKFEYKFYVVKDGQYGRLVARSRQARWTGLVGELVAGNAHLALPTLVLTEERYKVVDFSARISTAHTKVLIRRPPTVISADRYLAPFDIPVWCLFLGTVVVFSIIYLIVNIYSPNCVHHPSLTNLSVPSLRVRRSYRVPQQQLPANSTDMSVPRFSNLGLKLYRLWDSFFAFLSSGLQQVPDDSPHCWSGRIVIVTFFLLVVIMHTSYSSTLVSYMYVLRPQAPFRGVSDLAATKDHIPCILMGSSHEELLKAHHGNVLQRIWDNNGQGLVASNEEGIERVFGGNCAFIGDNINIEYLLRHNCSFTYVGNDFLRVHYHLAFQKGFPHQTAFSVYLVKLRQGGHLTRLLKKHFNPIRSACINHSGQTTLGFSHVISVFVELVGGIFLAVVVLVLEKLIYMCSKRKKKLTVSVYFAGELNADE